MTSNPRPSHLVTTALTYANGPMHLGHMLEQVQADIWVRFLRMQGHRVWFLSGSDAHGTPITIRAQRLGVDPETLVNDMHQRHRATCARFGVHFDQFLTTHDATNRVCFERTYQALLEGGHLVRKTIEQLYDTTEGMFLPDRLVKGRCPCCQAPDQYGDHCEVCGSVYPVETLLDPTSTLSNTPPVRRQTDHTFFQLSRLQPALKSWLNTSPCQDAVTHKLQEWLDDALLDWDITRDAPYFGFPLPDHPDQFGYVWLDAPLGYLAATQAQANHQGLTLEDVWGLTSTTHITHVVGKDITYFHGLFWPAVLHAVGLKKPDSLHAHGFLCINGTKMSKSRGTWITADHFAAHCPPEALRYYFASKLNDRIEDVDLNLDDFRQKVNVDLVGKVVNIASRCSKLLATHFDNRLATSLDHPALLEALLDDQVHLAEAYQHKRFSQAVRRIMEWADRTNQHIAQAAPWTRAKSDQAAERASAHQVCSLALHMFRVLMLNLKPILPELAAATEQWFGEGPWSWDDAKRLPHGATLRPYEHLMQRLDAASIQALLDDHGIA